MTSRCTALRRLSSFALNSAAPIALAALVVTACEPNAGYLRRWANTPDSEDRFVEYLQDSTVSHEVHVAALELLLEQWDYSMSVISSGSALRGMEDSSERNATIQDTIPHLRSLYDQGEGWTHKMRDAAYHLRRSTDDQAVQQQLEELIFDWTQNHWDPCQQNTGVVRTSDLLEVVGEERATAKLVEVVKESAFDRLLCLGRDVSELAWMHASEAVATAYLERWGAGELTDNEQLKFEFLEHMMRFNQTVAMRTWMFEQLLSDEIAPLHKNVILDVVSDNPTDADIDGYTRLLSTETNGRWAAFEAIVNARGSDGLELALSELPSTGEYGFYNGAVRPDGLKSVTGTILCEITKLSELGDNARVVFERHMQDENVHARLIAIACLAKYGDAQTVTRLRAYRRELGRRGVPAPGFGEDATIQSVIDDTVVAIQERR